MNQRPNGLTPPYSEGQTLDYQVTVLPGRHELQIDLRIPAALQSGVTLQCPTWVPGNYDFKPYARDVFELTARDAATGEAVAVVRNGWQQFHVDARSGQALEVRYRVYAFAPEFGEPCGLVDTDFAIVLGPRFLAPAGWTGPCSVTYTLPEGWHVHHPSGARPAGPLRWDYGSYDLVLDTPVVLGRFDRLTRNVAGVDFHCVFVDRTLGFAERAGALADQLAASATEMHRMFGAFPFKDYSFILTFNPDASWGLEHLTSTMCSLDPHALIDDTLFASSVRVCTHELFHAWNVRRLRPAPLDRLDLREGSFSTGLWVAEGFTRYYEFLFCTRTGIYSPQQFMSALANYFNHLSSTPAYRRVSACDSSLATFLNHHKYNGRCNNAIDYYDKGMLIAFGLDLQLRQAGRQDSLDQAFRAFYEAYAGRGDGYSTDDLRRFLDNRQAGLGEQMARMATSPAGLPMGSWLQSMGFQLQKASVPSLGLMFLDSQGPVISNVLDTIANGPAPGDIIERVNGYPYSFAALRWAARHCPEVQLTVSRGQNQLHFVIAPEPLDSIASLVWEGTPAQAAMLGEWFGCAFAPTPGQVFALDFYENFHGVETIV